MTGFEFGSILFSLIYGGLVVFGLCAFAYKMYKKKKRPKLYIVKDEDDA